MDKQSVYNLRDATDALKRIICEARDVNPGYMERCLLLDEAQVHIATLERILDTLENGDFIEWRNRQIELQRSPPV